MTHDCKVAEPRAKIEWRNLDAISLGLSLWCRALRIKCSHDFYGEIWRFFWPFQIDLSREFQLALHMPPWHNRRKCIAMCMQHFSYGEICWQIPKAKGNRIFSTQECGGMRMFFSALILPARLLKKAH